MADENLTIFKVKETNKEEAAQIHVVIDGKEYPEDDIDPMYEELYNGKLSDIPEKFDNLRVYNIGKIADSSTSERIGAFSISVSLFEARDLEINKIQREQNNIEMNVQRYRRGR